MATCIHRFMRDESGLVITAELIMIITIAVISLSAGWGAVASMLAEELEDVANSVGSLDQSYNYRGISAPGHASCSGGGFNDSANLVNVSTSSNFNASVAGLDFAPLIPNLPTPEINLAGEPFVLVEEEFGMNVQIDEALLVELQELGIVSIREDGAVLLLREDLIEVQEDGSILILDEEIRREAAERQQSLEQLQQSQAQQDQTQEGRIRARARLGEIDEAREEFEALRRKVEAAQSGSDSAELRQENARLRKLIDKLCWESQAR